MCRHGVALLARRGSFARVRDRLALVEGPAKKGSNTGLCAGKLAIGNRNAKANWERAEFGERMCPGSWVSANGAGASEVRDRCSIGGVSGAAREALHCEAVQMRPYVELLNPAGLWTLTALVPLVVLYILKIKRQRLTVSSTWLWNEAQRDLLARSPFRRLVAQTPLFLQALGLIALALALSRPSTRGRTVIGDHVALVIDTSASMSALDASGKSRLDLAKAAGIEVIRALAPGSDAIVLEAARDARVAAPLDRDGRRLTTAIEQLSTTDTEGDLGPAVALAVDRLRQLGGFRRVVVLTDGALARPASLGSVGLPLEVIKVGAPVDNTGIVRVDVRSGTDPVLGTDQVQAFAMIANFGATPRDLFVTLRESNASDILASRRLLVRPGERTPVVLAFQPNPGDIGQGLLIEISPHDAMPVDDVAYARVPSGSRFPVVLALLPDKSSPWIERALLSDPLVDVMKAPAGDPASIGIPQGALIVVDGVCPVEPGMHDILVVDPPAGSCLGASIGRLVDRPIITSWADADPRLRFLTLDGVQVARANLLGAESARQELVHAREGTLIADASSPGRIGTIVGFDVGNSDWPLKASFVLFVRNIVELARTHRAQGVANAARAGEPIRLTVPPQIDKVEVAYPDGSRREIGTRGALAVFSDTFRAGIYHASWAGSLPGSVTFAVNLTSEHESDLTDRPIDIGHEPATTVTRADQLADAHVEWTWLAAAVALFMVIADVWILTRRPRVLAPREPPRPRIPERRTQ